MFYFKGNTSTYCLSSIIHRSTCHVCGYVMYHLCISIYYLQLSSTSHLSPHLSGIYLSYVTVCARKSSSVFESLLKDLVVTRLSAFAEKELKFVWALQSGVALKWVRKDPEVNNPLLPNNPLLTPPPSPPVENGNSTKTSQTGEVRERLTKQCVSVGKCLAGPPAQG